MALTNILASDPTKISPLEFTVIVPADPPVERAISDEALFKVAKEIVVKFIEVGRLTPASFEEDFERVYRAVERTVRGK